MSERERERERERREKEGGEVFFFCGRGGMMRSMLFGV